jgi:hypothetical protein
VANGLLYRVGIDCDSGGWNAPCRKDGAFCYVPISEDDPRGNHFDHVYEEFSPFVAALGGVWPNKLTGPCHLDPDFCHLTYGDVGSRAKRIREFILPGSFIVFWAGLRWIDGPKKGDLVCSIIGFFRVSHVLRAVDVSRLDTHRNAHTRRPSPSDDDIVVFADPSDSGRLRRHLPIGDFRDRAQRIFPNLLTEWGGLQGRTGELLQDGYIQRSGNPPILSDPDRFLKWFRRQRPSLLHCNNVCDPD